MNRKTLKNVWVLFGLSSMLLATSVVLADVDEAPILEAVERHLSTDVKLKQWVQDPERVDASLSDEIEVREKDVDGLETIKLQGLVDPIRFPTGVAEIPDDTIATLGEILAGMRDRLNVRLHFIGHADNQPLSPRLQAVYVDNFGLSRERAGKVAEHFKDALALPAEAISYDWRGDTDPLASNDSELGRSQNRRVEVEVWYDEPVKRTGLEEVLVTHDVKRLKVCRMETVCKLRYVEGHANRAKVKNLIAPLRFGEESIAVTDDFIGDIERALTNLADKENVVVKFIGYTDDSPLAGRVERIYGDHTGLAKARARRAALAVQDALNLSSEAILSDGRGIDRPVASNQTREGRALNRRVEVEFWYDDPLQELPNEPMMCPDSEGAEVVTRVYDPPWGDIANLDFVDGRPVIPAHYAATLERALSDIADKTNPRLRFVGFTRNERLARRTAAVYGDDIGLSASRARRAMDVLAEDMQLAPNESEFEGRGFVHSDDVVNAGFIQGETSHVAVQAVYDELAILDDYEGVDITRMTRELKPENPLGLNLMRITVDGEPIDDPKRSSSDIQRCTDVALEEADIQFGFDNLRSAPRLAVAAKPARISLTSAVAYEPWNAVDALRHYTDATGVAFRMYTNYSYFIERAEVRIFANGQSVQAEPLAVIDIAPEGIAKWQPKGDDLKHEVGQLAYVLRAYGTDGNFDETAAQPIFLVHENAEDVDDENPLAEDDAELFASYGENALTMHNIGLSSGTVNVRGTGIRDDQEVWVAGRPIPIDESGSFVTEEILPEGAHTVEVAVIDKEDGRGNLYLRDLEFKERDWFYVAMADLTIAENSVSGPIDLFQGENSVNDIDSNLDGRLAFFVNGKFGDHWKLTASADTREGPLEDLFSNFMDKSPDSLFRRIDPDYYYPTFGDDSTVQELAPSMGKFFVRFGKDDDYGQWGNFKVAYMNNELAQVDRGLYGGNVHFQTDATTGFGERRFVADTFAAEPGTIASREEFRGTGGSLYYLNRQDVLAGSERVRIEIRDKASGLVTGVRNLTPALDYDIDYLQGRVLLSEPLASTADDNLLVRDNANSGDAAYLVVRYEYTPGFDDIDSLSTGGQAHYWFGDYVKLGVTANQNEQDDNDSSLQAADLTFRWAAESWLKYQQSSSEGLVSLPTQSDDGGYAFNTFDAASFVNAEADAERIDLSVSLSDFFDFTRGKLTVYEQTADAGYTAPGLTTLTDTRIVGGTFTLPVGERFSFGAKMDTREQEFGVNTSAREYNIGYQLGDRWNFSAGYREDERTDGSIIVPFTQEQGERVDRVVQMGYNSQSTWDVYAFSQDTVSVTGNRQENGRFGVGGGYRVTEKLKLEAEISDGDLGQGGRIGTNYIHSDHTSMYLNYALENERTDNGLPTGRGREGNLVAGIKSRIADSTSVYLEERYQHNLAMTGLTHATGINFAPTSNWNFGLTTDIGTLQDVQTGAETDRLATGVQVGYSTGKLQLSSGIEYRSDEVEQPDLSYSERTTWLYRNSFKYQLNPGARFLGKFNHSESDNSEGAFYDGGFTEAVLGYAYRPVDNDRLNTLVKYTYFYNMPTSGQIGAQNVASEFVQKSHIASVDVTYDITNDFTLGAKYGYRLGRVSLDREDPLFFDNNASLYVIRGDYRFRKNWELLVETRLLDMPDLNESRSGALASVSRYVGDHLKIGLGYNFSDFSDDLTDLSYDHSGVFLNLTGSM